MRKFVSLKKRGSPEATAAAVAFWLGTQRTASATTMPSALSLSVTDWPEPPLKSNTPSENHVPPPLRWSTATELEPAALTTTYGALLARLAPEVQRTCTS